MKIEIKLTILYWFFFAQVILFFTVVGVGAGFFIKAQLEGVTAIREQKTHYFKHRSIAFREFSRENINSVPLLTFCPREKYGG